MRKEPFNTGKRQSQQYNSCLKVPFSSSEWAYWLENLCSFDAEGQTVERRKVSPTLQLSPGRNHLPHTAVTLCRVWKEEILPIPCLLPAVNNLFFNSVAVSTGWSPLPSFLYVCLFLLISILTFIPIPIPT